MLVTIRSAKVLGASEIPSKQEPGKIYHKLDVYVGSRMLRIVIVPSDFSKLPKPDTLADIDVNVTFYNGRPSEFEFLSYQYVDNQKVS